MSLKHYYGPNGSYLKDHNEYFSSKQLQTDVDFLIKALKLKKEDRIIDIACGDGRHTIELKKRGYNIDGLDFSDYLIGVAKEQAVLENLKINFYRQDVHKIKLKKAYSKIFLFFSEFGAFNAKLVLKNIGKIIKKNGLFLLDCDNVFRVLGYLREHPKSLYKFDFVKMKLLESGQHGNKSLRYYTFPELEIMFNENDLLVDAVYGSYDKKKLNIESPRMILIGKKK